jgi:hypothetical protein
MYKELQLCAIQIYSFKIKLWSNLYLISKKNFFLFNKRLKFSLLYLMLMSLELSKFSINDKLFINNIVRADSKKNISQIKRSGTQIEPSFFLYLSFSILIFFNFK